MTYLEARNLARKLRNNPTNAEIAFWEKVRKRRFCGYRFNRQFLFKYQPIHDWFSYYIVDFFCFEKKLIVEIDGKYHFRKDQIARDRIREENLLAMGLHIIRFTDEDVQENWEKVAKQLNDKLNMI